jgi:hypothetical protein
MGDIVWGIAGAVRDNIARRVDTWKAFKLRDFIASEGRPAR